MSLMDMFRSAAPAQVPPTNPNAPTSGQVPPNGGVGQPGQIPQPAAPATAQGNGVVPASTPEPAAPLDKFKDLWNNDPSSDPNKRAPLFNVDPAKVMEAASKVDFTSAITPDMLQAISRGGEEAMKAFGNALQATSQNVFAQSLMSTTKLIENAIDKTRTEFSTSLPGMVKSQAFKDGLLSENPALASPAAQPLIQAMQAQFLTKYPNATEQELRGMAKEYLTSFAAVVAPQQPTATKSGQRGIAQETDWEKFFNS